MAEAAEEVAEPELGKNVVHLRTFGTGKKCCPLKNFWQKFLSRPRFEIFLKKVTDGRTDGRTDGWMDGRTDGRTDDGRTDDGRTVRYDGPIGSSDTVVRCSVPKKIIPAKHPNS